MQHLPPQPNLGVSPISLGSCNGDPQGLGCLLAVEPSVKKVIIDFENAWVVDHTVLEKLHGIERAWTDRKLIMIGLDDHRPMSSHELAARRKSRPAVAA